MEEKLCRDRFGYAVKKLREMRKNKIYTDVILECQGGCIHAHRCVLMAASPFFYNLLTSNFIGDCLIHIEFETIPVSVIEAIVASFYGEIQSSLQNDAQLIRKVLDTCQNMHEELLINYCINSLLNNMSLENCFQYWDLTLKFENTEAEERVITFVLNHLAKLLEVDVFQNRFSKLSVDQMEALISFAKEAAIQTESLAHAIISWGKRSPEATLEKIIAFFCLLDVSKLSRGFIEQLISSEFVKNSMELTKFLSMFSIATERELHHKQDLQLHFFYNSHGTDGKIMSQMYSMGRREWCIFSAVQLPISVGKDWYPLIALTGEKFYFAISCEKKFVAYSEKNRQIYSGPSVSLENPVTGVVDGKNMYIWNYEKLVKFDIDTKGWRSLTPIVNVISHCNLMAIDGKLFYHASSLATILMYNFSSNEWEFQKPLRGVTNIISIRCKCLQKRCKKKLYFVRDEKQLVSYDTERDVWASRDLPELNTSQPLFMNCDESFIVFGDKFDKSIFFIYYPVQNAWKTIECRDFTWQTNGFSCDICLR